MEETELKEGISAQEAAGPGGVPEGTAEGLDAEEAQSDDELGWDDVQEEMRASAGKPHEEELGWDDIREEMEASGKPVRKEEVGTVRFKEIKKGDTKKGTLDLDCILDIPLTLTVELGRNRILISDLLELSQGSVIELTKLAGEPMDVFANNKLIAMGEVVVVNEKFGVRLIDIASRAERLNKLK